MSKEILNETVSDIGIEAQLRSIERLYYNFRASDVLYILQLITKPVTSWPQYQAGLIDRNYNLKKVPTTQKEKELLPPMFMLIMKLVKDLLPFNRSSKWSSYMVAYQRIFATATDFRNESLIQEDGEGGTPALTTANIAPVPAPFKKKVIKRKAPDDVKVKKVSKKLFDKIKTNPKDIKKLLPETLKEMKENNNKYLYIQCEEEYIRIKLT